MRLIRGGQAPLVLGSVTIHIVTEDRALPFVVDALVTEEDRWLSLAPPRELLVEDPNALRTTTRAHDAEPHPLGSAVVAAAGPPLLVRAVVIDVEADPCCTAGAVERATVACALECRDHGARAVRVPLLGTAHGRLDPLESLGAVVRAFLQLAAVQHIDVALVVPSALRDRALERMHELGETTALTT